MKLSRLTNRQLRNLLRKGEVRFDYDWQLKRIRDIARETQAQLAKIGLNFSKESGMEFKKVKEYLDPQFRESINRLIESVSVGIVKINNNLEMLRRIK